MVSINKAWKLKKILSSFPLLSPSIFQYMPIAKTDILALVDMFQLQFYIPLANYLFLGGKLFAFMKPNNTWS